MRDYRRGISLIGLIITLVCIGLLFAILVPTIQNATKATGGGGGVQKNQATTHSDRAALQALFQSMTMFAGSNNSRLPSPTLIARSDDKSLDTTANFYSAMIAQQLCRPSQLISGNEQSDVIWEDDDYKSSYNPSAGEYWDESFTADLKTGSNVSFAHQVLYGDRYRRGWSAPGPSTYPVLSNRGPQDGIPDPNSWTMLNGRWAGNVVFADGHVNFDATMSATAGDHLFQINTDAEGDDVIMSFTKNIWDGGFELQWD